MNENFKKAKRIIIGQTKLMKEDNFDLDFINDFNSNTIKSLSEKFNFSEEEISKLKEIYKNLLL